MLAGIEVHHIRVAQIVRLLAREDTRSVVAAGLDVTCSTWSSTVLFAVDNDLYGRHSALEVGPDGRAEDYQHSLVRRLHAQTHLRPDQQRAQVERCPRLVGGNIFDVALDDLIAGLREHLDRRHGQAELAGRRLHAARIGVHTEYTHLAVHTAECLQALEGLQAVMEARRRHVHLDILVLGDLHVAPLAILVVVARVDVGLHVVEAQRLPINRFHNILIFTVLHP